MPFGNLGQVVLPKSSERCNYEAARPAILTYRQKDDVIDGVK